MGSIDLETAGNAHGLVADLEGRAAPLVHLHIPKTGGQTLGMRLGTAFPPERVYYMEGDITAGIDDEKLTRLLATKSFISCHFNGSVFAERGELEIICLARDPVEQIVSSYLHIMREPRHLLHAYCTTVSYRTVFELLPQHFFNVQSTYLVSAFRPTEVSDSFAVPQRRLARHLYDCADRLTWFGPVERLDDVVDFVAMDLRLRIMGDRADTNRAFETDSAKVEEIKAWLRARPERYSVDLLLYEEAWRRFAEFRRASVRKLARVEHVGTSQTSDMPFRDGDRYIRLMEGWHPVRTVEGWGREYRAGPGHIATIEYRAAPSDRWLVFSFAFVAGTPAHQLTYVDRTTGETVDPTLTDDDGIVRCRWPLAAGRTHGSLSIIAPAVYPLGFFSGNPSETDLIPYSTGRWSLEAEQPDGAAQARVAFATDADSGSANPKFRDSKVE